MVTVKALGDAPMPCGGTSANSDIHLGHGSGSSLPLPVLQLAGVCTLVAVVVGAMSIWLQLSNYRKPLLQRMVVRIMLMVPLYGVASFISLFSLEAAFFIDAVRDIYEAFVIYCFFVLLLDYLGGERSLLILLHGRPPIPAVFPVNLWRNEIDSSDPYTFLFLKRGILQYVQVKPLLALVSFIMKVTGTYNEGDFRAGSGYLYVSIVYNISICLALWCLAVFWTCVNDDLKPFRPVPKFLCVKGIVFFSFWQSIVVSFLVAVGVITRLGPYTDREHISLGLTDTLICIEMPFFAAAHMYAFSYRDFVSSAGRRPIYVARMTLRYALGDAFGLKDLVEDTRATLRGEGINYRAFEPSEGAMHIGAARERRIRAGLRYADGGKHKYWLPEVRGEDGDATAPLFVAEAEAVVRDAPDVRRRVLGPGLGDPGWEVDDGDGDGDGDGDEYGLAFGDGLAGPAGVDEGLYECAKRYVFGDYLYPVVDVSEEEARRAMWDEEARVVREIVSGGEGYGATREAPRRVGACLDEEEGEDRTQGGSSRGPRTPSPPRSNMVPECPPTARGSTHAHSRSQSPHKGTSQLGLGSLAASSPRAQRRGRAPLVAEDAVDLVVSAEGPRAQPGAPLIRVWDEHSGGSRTVSPRSPRESVERSVASSEQAQREVEETATVVAVTPPAYARLESPDVDYDVDYVGPGEERNPWA